MRSQDGSTQILFCCDHRCSGSCEILQDLRWDIWRNRAGWATKGIPWQNLMSVRQWPRALWHTLWEPPALQAICGIWANLWLTLSWLILAYIVGMRSLFGGLWLKIDPYSRWVASVVSFEMREEKKGSDSVNLHSDFSTSPSSLVAARVEMGDGDTHYAELLGRKLG